MTAIEVRDLSKRYGEVQALNGVTFSVEPGEIIGLLGPNGAGKTTLMKILTGVLQQESGEARIHGIDVLEDRLALQKRIGYLPENAPLYGDMMVQEYLQTMATLARIEPDKMLPLLSEAIYATGLEDYLTHPIGTLSKGYRQRVGIAQAIVHKPDVLILDEPTTGLDPTQIADIRNLIKRLAAHSTVLLSTHILPEVEMTCERVLIIMRGALKADAPLAKLRSGNSTVVKIEEGTTGVQEALSRIEGAIGVESAGSENGYTAWRIRSESGTDLARVVHDVVREKNWHICELRCEERTLETVFRELAEQEKGAEQAHPEDGAAEEEVAA